MGINDLFRQKNECVKNRATILIFVCTTDLHRYMKSLRKDIHDLSYNAHVWSKIYRKFYHCIFPIDNEYLRIFAFVDDQMCMSFYYHMYGSAIGTLKVSVANSDISQSLFTKTSNQGNQWYFQKVYIPVLPNIQVCNKLVFTLLQLT